MEYCEECGEEYSEEGCSHSGCTMWDECDECGDIFETGGDCGCQEEYE